MYKALVIGAGRIGAGFNWHDDAYTHAGAYEALKGRVELIGFVEPDPARAQAAEKKWRLLSYETFEDAPKADIYSVCVQPEEQDSVLWKLSHAKAIWCEKPLISADRHPVMQINYLRRADRVHRTIAMLPDIQCDDGGDRYLFVTAKDDIHTRCHFEDLARWWKATLVYTKIDGPNSYFLRFRNVTGGYSEKFFSLGGIDGGPCMKAMLGNILDHLDFETPLWSPAS